MANETVKNGSAVVGLAPGARIGKYEVKERLAIGGQAVIYKCYDSLLDRCVAIKQVSTHLAEDAQFLDRFRKEAQVLARLGARQPAIVSIFELLEDERGLFIVMEHVEGVTLERTLQDNPGPVEPKATLQVLWRLAGALHDVHQAGIIHRDIKPANIIVGDGLRPKITDFGVAASLTGQTSMLLGTTRYMAPELLSGHHFDGRADMYSLGFIAYEMLVGRAKFNEIFAEILRDKHSEALRWMKWHSNLAVQAPPLHEVNPGVPRAMSDIVAKMMDKDPAKRFENMEALGRAIKTGFSPRAKAAGGAKEAGEEREPQPRHRDKRHRRASEVVAQAHALPADEGDELEIAGGPATAPIPKAKMSRRTKIAILSSVVAVAMAALIVMAIVKAARESTVARQREQLFAAAVQNVDTKGDYVTALRQFKDVQARYPGSDEAAKAVVMTPLTEAHLAVQAKDWKQAADKEAEAGAACQQLNSKASGALLAWARNLDLDLKKFARYRTGMQEFFRAMDDAGEALKAARYEDARRIVTGMLGKPDVPGDKRNELASLAQKINVAEFKGTIEGLLKKGQEQLAAGNFEGAEKAYQDAAAKLGGDEAKVLTKEDRKAMQDMVARKMKDLGVERDFARLMDEIKQARDAKDRDAEKGALERAIKIRPLPDLEQRLGEVQSEIALAKGQTLEAQKKYPEALQAYIDSLKFMENKAARDGADRIDKLRQMAAKVAAANAAYDAGNSVEALKLYEEVARAGGADDAVRERMRDCKYRIGMAEGDALRDQKQYDKAMRKYEEARGVKPEASALIDEREAKMKLTQEYDTLVAEGLKALTDGRHGDAIASLTKAQKKIDTEEVRLLLKKVKFTQSLMLGKEALNNSPPDLASAESYFKISLGYAATDEEKKMVEGLIREVQDKRDKK